MILYKGNEQPKRKRQKTEKGKKGRKARDHAVFEIRKAISALKELTILFFCPLLVCTMLDVR